MYVDRKNKFILKEIIIICYEHDLHKIKSCQNIIILAFDLRHYSTLYSMFQL